MALIGAAGILRVAAMVAARPQCRNLVVQSEDAGAVDNPRRSRIVDRDLDHVDAEIGGVVGG